MRTSQALHTYMQNLTALCVNNPLTSIYTKQMLLLCWIVVFVTTASTSHTNVSCPFHKQNTRQNVAWLCCSHVTTALVARKMPNSKFITDTYASSSRHNGAGVCLHITRLFCIFLFTSYFFPHFLSFSLHRGNNMICVVHTQPWWNKAFVVHFWWLAS